MNINGCFLILNLFKFIYTDFSQVQTPFIEPYLKRKATCPSEAIGALDMLWKYYEKCKNFSAAARILSRLAERHG